MKFSAKTVKFQAKTAKFQSKTVKFQAKTVKFQANVCLKFANFRHSGCNEGLKNGCFKSKVRCQNCKVAKKLAKKLQDPVSSRHMNVE